MSFNLLSEVKYKYRLALKHLERAERLFYINYSSSSSML
jgi:hypothetical protein